MNTNDDETIEAFLNGARIEKSSKVRKSYQVIKKDSFDARIEAFEYVVGDYGVLHFFGKDDLCICSFKEWDYVQLTPP